MLYIREDIPSNLLAINLRNKKYLINCSHNPHKTMIKTHLATLSNFLDLHSSKYEKMLILGDFNAGIDEPRMISFCETYNLTNLIKQPTCYKNPDNPTCIHLILTNFPRTFQSICVIETGLPDFHSTTLTIMRKTFKKQRPRIIDYRSLKHFSNEEFRKSLIDNLCNEIYGSNDDGFNRFCKMSIDILNSFALIKKTFVRANQMPFIITLKRNNEKVEAEKQLFTKENTRNPQVLCKTKE